MKNISKNFKWLSLITAILIVGSGALSAVLLWGTDSASSPSQPIEKPNTDQAPPEYTADLFPKIIERELEELGLVKNVSFSCRSDSRFAVSGTFTDLDSVLQNADLTLLDRNTLSLYSNQRFLVEGHIGINEKGNGKFILDRITSAETELPADIATDLIDTQTDLNKLVDAPFEEIEMTDSGVVFRGELPLFIRIALYTLPTPSEPA